MRQADGSAEMKKLAVLIAISAGLTWAAVDGVVVNQTTGKPQQGATVTLFQTSQEGPQFVDSAKSGPDGKFTITKEPAQTGGGPMLLQAVYGGVQYNKMLTPGTPTSGVEIPVYESSKKPAGADVAQHIMLLQPDSNGILNVNEIYDFQNKGKLTWNDPDHGELQFALPAAAQGKVEIDATAPGGMPIRRSADPVGKPNTFKLDFPIKPGETRIDLSWTMPFNAPGVFEDRVLMKTGAPTRVLVPQGVTLKGDGVENLGPEPQIQATIYSLKGPDLRFDVEGTGVLRDPNAGRGDGQDNGSPALTQNLPKLFNLELSSAGLFDSIGAVKWILLTVIATLALGFILLYKKGDPVADAATAEPADSGNSNKATKHARGRG
jgi:hypothetical protein